MIKLNLYVDGNFAFHIHKHLLNYKCYKLDWELLKNYLCDCVSKEENDKVVINSAYYFMGIVPEESIERRKFQYELKVASINKITLPLKTSSTGGFKEDGIDTSFVLKALDDMHNAPYNYAILFAGDSDFVPLIPYLKKSGVKVVIVYYDFKNTRASKLLLEKADYRISLELFLSEWVDKSIGANSLKVEVESEKHNKVSVSTPETVPTTLDIPNVEDLKKVLATMSDIENEYVLVGQFGRTLKENGFSPKRLKTLLIGHQEVFDIIDIPKAKALSVKLL